MKVEERLEAGRAVRREVLGAAHVGAGKDSPSKFRRVFEEFTVDHCWGNVWTRPGLDRATRSRLNLAMLAVMARWKEFGVHVVGALNNGVTEDEIIEIILQAGVYGGVPVAAEAMRVAEETIERYRAENPVSR